MGRAEQPVCTEFETSVQDELSSVDCRHTDTGDCGGSDIGEWCNTKVVVVWCWYKYGEVNSKFTELCWNSKRVSEADSEEDKLLHS
jgi:hypothetical protein